MQSRDQSQEGHYFKEDIPNLFPEEYTGCGDESEVSFAERIDNEDDLYLF